MIREKEAKIEDRKKRFNVHIIGVDLEGKQNSGLQLLFKAIIQENVSEMKEDLNLHIQKSIVYLGKLPRNSQLRHTLVEILDFKDKGK